MRNPLDELEQQHPDLTSELKLIHAQLQTSVPTSFHHDSASAIEDDALPSPSPNAQELAFLSACQTAVGDGTIPEESMRLAASMLAVGFKGVIATQGSIGGTGMTSS